MQGMELLFLGTGTSAGIPMIGCKCQVCQSADPRDKRNRVSVVISYGQTRVLIDTPPELRLECVAHGVERIDAVVFTHGHADHIMGLDDVRRFNTICQGPLDVWADARTHDVLTQCFGYAFRPPDPVSRLYRPHLIRRLIDNPFVIGEMTWQPIPLLHGNSSVLGFRVGPIAYCTDVSGIPDESLGLLQDLELLVVDGLQWHGHVAHFSLDQAMEVSRQLKARRTLFTHIAHSIGHEITNSRLPADMQLAYDGQVVKIV